MSDNRILEVVDEEGKVIGRERRERIHREGLLHREVHVWLYTPDGDVILQRWARDKDMYPGLLDTSVGGHVEIGADYEESAITEMREEAGIVADPSSLELVTMYPRKLRDESTGNTNNFLRAEYLYRYDGDIAELRVEEGEGTGFEAWPVDRLLDFSEEERRQFIPGHLEGAALAVLDHIRLRLGL